MDAILDFGRNGGSTQTTWTVLPYGVDPTLGGFGRGLTLTILYPADSAYINSSTPLANRRFVPSYLWQLMGVPVGYDSVPVASGTFPLIVNSPSLGGDSFLYASQCYVLASHGFICAMLDFAPGDVDFIDPFLPPLEQNLSNGTMTDITERCTDVKHTIDHFFALNNVSSSLFYHHVITDDGSVVGMGHSFGGLTVLATASGVDSLRGTAFSVTADTRIGTLLLQDPSDWQLSYAQLRINNLPTLVLNSLEASGICGIRTFYANKGASLSVRVKLNNSLHASFETDVCPLLFLFGIDPALYGFAQCDPSFGFIDPSVALTIINTYTTAFLELLSGDVRYIPYFISDCAAYIEGGQFEMWSNKAGSTAWNPPTTVADNLGYGNDLAYLAFQDAFVTDGNFRFRGVQVAQEPHNCSISILS
jgi:hypothetical protein